MSIEKPKKPEMKIVHIKENFGKNEESPLEPERIDLEFIEKIVFDNPEQEERKNQLLRLYKNETNEDIKKEYWDTLVEFVVDSSKY